MQSLNAALRRYYRTIRSYLPCSHKLKKSILNEIQGNVDAYLTEFPDADITQIEARFGTPQAIAAAYVDDMDTRELLHSMLVRKRIIRTVIAGVMAALLLWGTVLCVTFADIHLNRGGYLEQYITEE